MDRKHSMCIPVLSSIHYICIMCIIICIICNSNKYFLLKQAVYFHSWFLWTKLWSHKNNIIRGCMQQQQSKLHSTSVHTDSYRFLACNILSFVSQHPSFQRQDFLCARDNKAFGTQLYWTMPYMTELMENIEMHHYAHNTSFFDTDSYEMPQLIRSESWWQTVPKWLS